MKAKAAKGSVTPKDGKPTVASAGAEASEPPGSGATAQADAALPVEAAKAEVSGPAGSGVTAQAAPTITSEAALADAPGPSGSGTSAQADSKTPPSPPHSFPLPPPGADKAGSALLHSSVELAEDANGDLTSPPPLFCGEAGLSQDRPTTPIPQANQGSLASCKASSGFQGKNLGDIVSKQAKSAGQGKKGNQIGPHSTRGR